MENQPCFPCPPMHLSRCHTAVSRYDMLHVTSFVRGSVAIANPSLRASVPPRRSEEVATRGNLPDYLSDTLKLLIILVSFIQSEFLKLSSRLPRRAGRLLGGTDRPPRNDEKGDTCPLEAFFVARRPQSEPSERRASGSEDSAKTIKESPSLCEGVVFTPGVMGAMQAQPHRAPLRGVGSETPRIIMCDHSSSKKNLISRNYIA